MKEFGVRTEVLDTAEMEAKYSAKMLVSFHQNVVAAQKTVIWLELCVCIEPQRNSRARTSVG